MYSSMNAVVRRKVDIFRAPREFLRAFQIFCGAKTHFRSRKRGIADHFDLVFQFFGQKPHFDGVVAVEIKAEPARNVYTAVRRFYETSRTPTTVTAKKGPKNVPVTRSPVGVRD